MTTIIGGKHGGRRLAVPTKGTRPTSARVREAVFSHLEHHDLLSGASVLDLFAGSGALGIEALSRGAHRVCLVDNARGAIQALNTNRRIDPTKIDVRAGDATRATGVDSGRWDLVFIDPPYEMEGEKITQILVALLPHLGSDPTIVIERDSRSAELEVPPQLENYLTKTYGETVIHYLMRQESQPE